MTNETVERTTLHELRKRGVTNPEEFASLADDVITETLKWFDGQGGRVGPGVLVRELRSGGRRPATQSRRNLLVEQEQYGDGIRDWLKANFPDLCDPSPHPGAVAAVIRLHHRYGKGQLTPKQHGEEIRRFVERWESRALRGPLTETGREAVAEIGPGWLMPFCHIYARRDGTFTVRMRGSVTTSPLKGVGEFMSFPFPSEQDARRWIRDGHQRNGLDDMPEPKVIRR